MSKRVFLFADSFGITTRNRNSWVDMLQANFHLINKSKGGVSTQEIVKVFLETVNRITPDDTVIIGISDPSRFYISDPHRRNESKEIYYELFYDRVISQIHYQGCLSKIKEVAKERNLKLLVFWSFPSAYTSDYTESWLDQEFDGYHDAGYVYETKFDNEIKPALIYISRREVPKNLTPDETLEFFTNDKRPNHIASVAFHEEMFDTVRKFINDEVSGQIMLSKRWIDYNT